MSWGNYWLLQLWSGAPEGKTVWKWGWNCVPKVGPAKMDKWMICLIFIICANLILPLAFVQQGSEVTAVGSYISNEKKCHFRAKHHRMGRQTDVSISTTSRTHYKATRCSVSSITLFPMRWWSGWASPITLGLARPRWQFVTGSRVHTAFFKLTVSAVL